MQFALAVPDEMSISHMALSRDGSMLVFVSPEENSAMPMLYVQRVGSLQRHASARHAGSKLSFLVARWRLCRIFRQRQIAENGSLRRHAAGARHRSSGTRRQLGKQGCDHLCSDAQSPLQRINADGTGMAQVTEYQDRWGSIPSLAHSFFPTATIFYSGRVTSRITKDDRLSGIYLEFSRRQGEKTCRPLPFEFWLRRPQFVLCG